VIYIAHNSMIKLIQFVTQIYNVNNLKFAPKKKT